MLRTLDRLYPRLGLLDQRIYADVFASGTPGHIHNFHNFADVLNAVTAQFYTDMIHVNEDGNRFIAERIAKIIPIRESAGPYL